MKIYLAHSLTQAPKEFKAEMEKLRGMLAKKYEVLEFFGLDSGTAADVFNHDIGCVKNCDAVLAEVSYPSTGIGIEITTALNLGKKVLAAGRQDAKISRMVVGMNVAGYKFIRYSNLEELANFDFNSL